MRELSIEEIEQAAKGFKEDMQRAANRMVRRHDTQGALAVLEAIEYIDKFRLTLKLVAGSQLKEYLSRPPRARPIHINKALKAK